MLPTGSPPPDISKVAEEDPRNPFGDFRGGWCPTKYVPNEEDESFQTHMYRRDHIVEPDDESDLPVFG